MRISDWSSDVCSSDLFGFGAKTALDFPNESAGIMRDTDDYSGTSMGSIPIGQGISVTALQMLEAYNVIANDGVYVPPKLVLETVGADGSRNPVVSGEERRVVSESTEIGRAGCRGRVCENV